MTAHWGDAPEPLTETRMMQYIRSKPEEDRAGIVGKRNVLGPAQWKRGLAKSGIEFDKKGRFVGSPRRVPEELIQPKEPQIIPEIEKDLQGNAENGIFSRGDDMADNVYSSGTGAVQPGRQPTDIERLRTMEPEVKEKDVEKILEKALQDSGKSVIFKNEDAISVLGLPVQANSERVKETLRQFESAIKDCKTHEIGVIVRPDGELVCVVRGIEDRVSIPSDWVTGNILTHNHPTGVRTLSTGDVLQFINDGGLEVRTVAHDGQYAYLKRGIDWNPRLGTEMQKEFPNKIVAQTKAIMRADKKYGHGKWSGQEIVKEMLNEWLDKNANDYGYINPKEKS
jgi:hypothetical protein